MSSNSDLLTSLDEMYEAANRRAEAAEWRDNYATGLSDGIWQAQNKVLLSPNWQKMYEDTVDAYGELNVELQEVHETNGSLVSHYQQLRNELLVMTHKIRDLADASAESEDSADWICGLIEIIRLLDGGDA